MPIYTFRDNHTGEESDKLLKISELDEFKENNPHLSQVIFATKTVSGVDRKPDSGFRDVLNGIKKANRGSNINTF